MHGLISRFEQGKTGFRRTAYRAVIEPLVMCPLCKGPFPIAEGSSTYSVNGIPVTLDGMKTTCGATLIASDLCGSVHR